MPASVVAPSAVATSWPQTKRPSHKLTLGTLSARTWRGCPRPRKAPRYQRSTAVMPVYDAREDRRLPAPANRQRRYENQLRLSVPLCAHFIPRRVCLRHRIAMIVALNVILQLRFHRHTAWRHCPDVLRKASANPLAYHRLPYGFLQKRFGSRFCVQARPITQTLVRSRLRRGCQPKIAGIALVLGIATIANPRCQCLDFYRQDRRVPEATFRVEFRSPLQGRRVLCRAIPLPAAGVRRAAWPWPRRSPGSSRSAPRHTRAWPPRG